MWIWTSVECSAHWIQVRTCTTLPFNTWPWWRPRSRPSRVCVNPPRTSQPPSCVSPSCPCLPAACPLPTPSMFRPNQHWQGSLSEDESDAADGQLGYGAAADGRPAGGRLMGLAAVAGVTPPRLPSPPGSPHMSPSTRPPGVVAAAYLGVRAPPRPPEGRPILSLPPRPAHGARPAAPSTSMSALPLSMKAPMGGCSGRGTLPAGGCRHSSWSRRRGRGRPALSR